MASYSSPKVEARESSIAGKGVFAIEDILKGELVFDFSEGTGKYISGSEMDKLFDEGMDYAIQVDDDLFFAATNSEEMEIGDYLNHSCDPNLGIKDSLKLIALKDVKIGEEVAFDYAMTESSDFEIKCLCGKSNCRRKITGEDWKRKDLQEKYKGYFSDYIAKKISDL
jgi:SET domain-containing protein